MTPDIASLEQATLAAVPPQAVEVLDGWLLGIDDGTVGRAHSAVPTRHEAVRHDLVEAIEARYAERGMTAVFRVPEAPAFDLLRQVLAGRGYRPTQPTLTMLGTVQGMASLAASAEVSLADTPGDAWGAVFLGEGFDPVDGASRLAILRRSRESAFAGATVAGRLAAVGSACFSHGWCGVHGMRTAPAWRGRGLAGSILAALGRAAQERGLERAFLQVERGNAAAQKLYRRAGLLTGWCYEYWRR